MQTSLRSLEAFALALAPQTGEAAYLAYLVEEAQAERTLTELVDELDLLDIRALAKSRVSANELVDASKRDASTLLVADASAFSRSDWETLDRRRSELQRHEPLVFVTTPTSFDELARHAPHLASWLGSDVYARPSDVERAQTAKQDAEARLAALRSLTGKSDVDVLQLAEKGTLPRDPEYAEWLVLLGRGDLLG